MVALATGATAASSDFLVLALANIATLQVALSSASIASQDSMIHGAASARPAMTAFLGQALHVADGDVLPGGRSYRVDLTVAHTLQTGNFAFDWQNGLVVLLSGLLAGQTADAADVATVLGSNLRLERLRTVHRRPSPRSGTPRGAIGSRSRCPASLGSSSTLSRVRTPAPQPSSSSSSCSLTRR